MASSDSNANLSLGTCVHFGWRLSVSSVELEDVEEEQREGYCHHELPTVWVQRTSR
jgi:hypothetical protein